MSNRQFDNRRSVYYVLLAVIVVLSAGCHSTRNLGPGQYLLRKNKVMIASDHPIARKGEIKDNLSRLIIQKTNTYALGIFPIKLTLYNRRYAKLHDKPDASLPKSIERPALIDTSLMQRSIQNMKSYMTNQGYFYAKIKDTFIIKHKKAYATYIVQPGKNYLINKVNYNIEDSNIARIVNAVNDETVLQKDKEFAYTLTDEERSRITAAVRNSGYYKFTQENVTFKIDTFDKAFLKNIENPFENAVNFISSPKHNKNPTIDIDVIIKLEEDTNAYKKYSIGSVHVYPDYNNTADLKDSQLVAKKIDDILFRYHDVYVHDKVLYKHIYLFPGDLYSQENEDKTHVKLNELGIFQYINLKFKENPLNKYLLDCNILLNETKKHDLSTNYELSSGSTYSLGNSLGVNFRDKNFMKGANLLTLGVSGGFEWAYNNGGNFFDNFSLLTKYYGANASIDLPKFLAPVASSLFDNSSLPHTIIGVGENVIDRVNYFTLVNTSANFTYSWRQTKTITWTFSPVFINIIRLPVETDSFKDVLEGNEYLTNSYKQNFIEGENLSFTYDNIIKKHGVNYSFLKLSVEEAGAALGVINDLGAELNDLYKIQFAQYTKYDFDARHYFTLPHSVIAMRFYGGIGIPYGQSTTLPYIKQYFAGGTYSLRGWRIRTLGPGSYYDINNINNADEIDRTGDIKLEYNAEYRFPIAPLFAGAVKMNGAIFLDAGNIWLAQKDTSYAGGNFQFNTLGYDIAVDIGVGTRFDIASFLTLRIDVAMPIKEPYVNTNGGWVFNQINPYDPTWRSNNIVFNISIGYPF
jgi:outer membrane protein insertion porin family